MFSKFSLSRADTNTEKIDEILNRGTEDIFIRENLRTKLLSGKKLRVKLGFDPTGPNIHIGRAIALKKLKAFQDLGHTAIFVVGDFTARIGDPSDKLEKRPTLSQREIEENLKNYKKQVGLIVDIKKAEFHFNSSWLSKLRLEEISMLAESFSVQQMTSRRNFRDRLDKGIEISLRELMYPLMQGYDSVMIKADVEIGGFDQLFNLKAGRIIQKHYSMQEQDVLTTQMLPGTDGRKMSTSWGNIISINDEPNDMFGKVMSVNDSLIRQYFVLCTDVSMIDIENIEQKLKQGANPKDIKMELAEKIVALYHGAKSALEAKENFVDTFEKGGIPDTIPQIDAKEGELLGELALKVGVVGSKSEFKRLVNEGAVTQMDNQETISNFDFKVSRDAVFKIGKRRFVKVKIIN